MSVETASTPHPTPLPSVVPDSRPRAARWSSRLVYPLWLACGGLACGIAVARGMDLSSMLPVIFVGIIASLVVLERVMPFRAGWQTNRGETVRDGIYLGQGVFFGGLGQLLASLVTVALAPGDNGLPLWLAVPLAVVLVDLCTYGFHRFVHANRLMWREHGIHHVPDKVNTLNANTAHFADILLNNLVAYTPLLALGFGPEAVFVATVVRALQNYGLHANLDVRLGWLSHVIMTPEHHRLHHSAEPSEAGNYATVLTLWDRVFGTLVWAPGRDIEAAGVDDPASFPAPHRILASAWHPVGWALRALRRG